MDRKDIPYVVPALFAGVLMVTSPEDCGVDTEEPTGESATPVSSDQFETEHVYHLERLMTALNELPNEEMSPVCPNLNGDSPSDFRRSLGVVNADLPDPGDVYEDLYVGPSEGTWFDERPVLLLVDNGESPISTGWLLTTRLGKETSITKVLPWGECSDGESRFIFESVLVPFKNESIRQEPRVVCADSLDDLWANIGMGEVMRLSEEACSE